MAGLKIKNETVYVIYRNGEPYEHVKKPVYATIGPAKGQVTQIAEEIARLDFDEKTKCNRIYNPDWWELSGTDRNNLIAAVKQEFEIVEYTPKGR